MTQKFVKRGMPVPGEYEAGVLKSVRVGEIMRNVATVSPETTVAELMKDIASRESGLHAIQGIPVVSAESKLVGSSPNAICWVRWRGIHPGANKWGRRD